ncbi:hypothetical protein Z517_11634 [Fonsecaea pedrosoi CBS 271.37]|uniref:Unplaced genomic scaffold supercont1.8, whole genome shotgun sequence n=1 Tax=Fonsecaea pedrosoi CBS 271.37 TaxID=1442368 RepID=A0A0D2GQY8_9EURO|nr:uncharacterized protein Z517_11634 [Fonsecaea pedrosoi CBS 271.37]KIW74864.1 hypothetical protein Z517_11634 [Fonsecaea pedrosoi CBS 271.37]
MTSHAPASTSHMPAPQLHPNVRASTGTPADNIRFQTQTNWQAGTSAAAHPPGLQPPPPSSRPHGSSPPSSVRAMTPSTRGQTSTTSSIASGQSVPPLTPGSVGTTPAGSLRGIPPTPRSERPMTGSINSSRFPPQSTRTHPTMAPTMDTSVRSPQFSSFSFGRQTGSSLTSEGSVQGDIGSMGGGSTRGLAPSSKFGNSSSPSIASRSNSSFGQFSNTNSAGSQGSQPMATNHPQEPVAGGSRFPGAYGDHDTSVNHQAAMGEGDENWGEEEEHYPEDEEDDDEGLYGDTEDATFATHMEDEEDDENYQYQ